MQEKLNYSIFILNESSHDYSLLYSTDNIYDVTCAYSYFIKKFRKKYIKVCRELLIFNGV